MAIVRHIDAFLLSREWRDTDGGVEVVLWARAAEAAVRVRLSRQEAVMFVPREVMTHSGRRVPWPLTMFDYGLLGTPGCRFFDPRLPTSSIARQLAPVCDVALLPLGTLCQRIAGAQTSLF